MKHDDAVTIEGTDHIARVRPGEYYPWVFAVYRRGSYERLGPLAMALTTGKARTRVGALRKAGRAVAKWDQIARRGRDRSAFQTASPLWGKR